MWSMRFVSVLFLIQTLFWVGFADLLVYSSQQCEDQCLRMKGCSEFKIEWIQNSAKYRCHLFHISNRELALRSKLLLSCDKKTCEHGGTCAEDVRSCRRFRCLCKKNWQGERCQIKIK